MNVLKVVPAGNAVAEQQQQQQTPTLSQLSLQMNQMQLSPPPPPPPGPPPPVRFTNVETAVYRHTGGDTHISKTVFEYYVIKGNIT